MDWLHCLRDSGRHSRSKLLTRLYDEKYMRLHVLVYLHEGLCDRGDADEEHGCSNSETSDENDIPKKGTASSSQGYDFGSIYIVKLKDHDRRLGDMRITTTYPTNK